MKIKTVIIARNVIGALALSALAALPPLRADEVTDWNQNMLTTAATAKLGPLPTSRVAAMVQSAVFDAVNGVYKRYSPVHVQPTAPRGTSAKAAAAQAAHDILADLFPGQRATLDAELATSIAELVDPDDGLPSRAVERGLAWGQYVASQIWAWRSADGFTTVLPPFLGGSNPGEWRPTPPSFAPGTNPQVAAMETWIIQSHSQFRPGGPPALDSAQYVADFNEIKVIGSANSAVRTADQTQFTIVWSGNTIGIWNRTALQIAAPRQLPLLQEARLLAQLNLALADASIGCWDAKYTYVFWRPITAIQLGDTDGNDATAADPTWTPLLPTPPFPDYPSNHACTGGAAAAVLAAWFGENTPFWITSETLPGVTRSFSSFSQATDELNDARVFGGIHFRTAVNVGRSLGQQVAEYVLENALQRVERESESD
jgi:PAP2 superfamily